MNDDSKTVSDERPPSLAAHRCGSEFDGLLRLIHWTSAASRHLRRRLADVAATVELTENELLVVWLCSGTGRIQIDLAGAIGVSPAQMSGLVERLRARGLVAMHRLIVDRRRQIWRTTAEGSDLLTRIAKPLAELSLAISRDLSAEQLQSTESLCERLAETLSTASGGAKRLRAALGSQTRDSREAA